MSETKIEQPAQVAARLNKEGKFGEALALVAPLVEKGDKQPAAFLEMSRALRGMKDDKAARDVEQRALELFPDNVWIAVHAANLLVSKDRDFAKALDLIGPHLATGSLEPGLVAIASIVLRGLNRQSEADAIELQGLAAHPDNAQLLSRRVTELNGAGRFADALELLAGKDAVVENSPDLKTQLQRAREGLADASTMPDTTPAIHAEARPSDPLPEALSVGGLPATAAEAVADPATVSESHVSEPAAPTNPAAEVSKPASETVPNVTPARPASVPSSEPTPVPALVASVSQPVTSRNAVLASMPTVPPPTQAALPLAKALEPPPTVSRQPNAQQSFAQRVPAATRSSNGARQATAAGQMTAAPGTTVPNPRSPPPGPTQPTHQVNYSGAKQPRSGMSAFGVISWGFVIVATGLLTAHYAGEIDLTPFFQQVSVMIEAARGS